jgi:predicted nucleic acid-binding protein
MKFLDTNILVYAYDTRGKTKHKKAQNILLDCWNSRSGIVSTQVLQEFYVTVTKKLPKTIPVQEAREIVKELLSWSVYEIVPADIIAASELEEQLKYSFWDSLIITAAQRADANILYSEDMQDGQQIGNLKIINPFQ